MCELHKNDPEFLFTCVKCGVSKRNLDYYKSTNSGRHYRSICKDCYRNKQNKDNLNLSPDQLNIRKKIRKKYNTANKEKVRKRHVDYKTNCPFHYLLSVCKNNARARKLEITINVENILDLWDKQEGRCYYTGDMLTKTFGNPNSMSLDRIDSSVGYLPDNIALCCRDVNIFKNKLSLDRLLDLSRKIIEKFNT